MIRKFNYTGRKKIPRKQVEIRIVADDDAISFDCQLDLAGLNLPPDAQVVVEAYTRFAFQRFPFGTVNDIRAPGDTRLGMFEGNPNVRYRVKVMDRSTAHGRLVAVADRLSAMGDDEDTGDRRPLLPVEYSDLGDQIWQIDTEGDEPVLLLNQEIDGISGAAQGDEAFLSLVYPAAVREVLRYVLIECGHDDDETADDDPNTLWIRFAMRFNRGQRPPSVAGDDYGPLFGWIEEVVDGFATELKARERYAGSLGSAVEA